MTSVNSPHGSLLTGLPRVFYAGDTVTIGTGDSAETRTIATAGTAVAPPTTLAEDAAAGTTNIKVAATAGYAPGDPLTIGSGSTQQNVTITAVGSPRLQTTLAAPAAAGATNIKLQSTGAFCIPLIGCFRDPVLQAGDVLEIGTGADQVTATIESVGTTPGATGDGVTLTEPLARASAAGTSVLNRGGGLTFSPALAASHAIGEPVNSLGGGFTFTEPLRKSHAAGDAVVNYNSPHWPQARWADAIQNDMAARVDWTQKSYREANHQPTVLVAGGRDRRARPGQRVRLWMVARDPDRDALAYSWWQYGEADTYDGAIRIRKADTRTPWFVVPADAEVGDSIHLVLQVSDDGAPTLTRYKRVVVNVR